MDEHVKGVLADFAKHTGYASLDATSLAKRYLAVHTRLVHPGIVYPYVGSDYALLSLRTHSPPLSAYCEDRMVDIPTFVHLMKHGYENKPHEERSPALDHFRENMMPRPVGEEAWVDYERKDHWKARAYFVGLNWKQMPQFYNLARAIYADGAERVDADAFGAFYGCLLDYKPYVQLEARELGAILSQLQLKDDAPVKAREPAEPLHLGDDATHGDARPKEPIVFVCSDARGEPWEAIHQNPLVQDYRRRAGLPATFPPQKLVKQMILASLNLSPLQIPGAQSLYPAARPLDETPLAVGAEAWPLLMNAIQSMDAGRHCLNAEAPLLRDMLEGSADVASTIQTALTLYHPEENSSLDPRTKNRLLKAHPEVEPSVIQSLLKM